MCCYMLHHASIYYNMLQCGYNMLQNINMVTNTMCYNMVADGTCLSELKVMNLHQVDIPEGPTMI